MGDNERRILTLNGGASSLKFALFRAGPPLVRLLEGGIDRIGLPEPRLTIRHGSKAAETVAIGAADQLAAADALIARLGSDPERFAFDAVGHRIVHGMDRHVQPCIVTREVRAELQRLAPLDPEHLPFGLELIDRVGRHWPATVQIACFDTAFHHDLPRVAQFLALPRRYFEAGVRRYGFHGLSCTFLLDELERSAGKALAHARLVLAHLGSGTSLTAVVDRRSVDTTMAFTPASGVPMGTRTGDIDPGIFSYLARTEGIDAERFQRLVNHESGLLGISGISSDIRDLLAREREDPRAAEAIEFYCYEIGKRIGALASAMGGIDGLVFSAGIGENSAPIRDRICARLGFLGVQLDRSKNAGNEAVISRDGAPVSVRVLRTDEERVIAEAVVRLFAARR